MSPSHRARRAFGSVLVLAISTSCIPVTGTGSLESPAYVEATTQGLLVSSRDCADLALSNVAVTEYNKERVVWSIEWVKGSRPPNSVLLFRQSPGYRESAPYMEDDSFYMAQLNDRYDVVFPNDLPLGTVAYSGSDTPISKEAFDALPNTEFSC